MVCDGDGDGDGGVMFGYVCRLLTLVMALYLDVTGRNRRHGDDRCPERVDKHC